MQASQGCTLASARHPAPVKAQVGHSLASRPARPAHATSRGAGRRSSAQPTQATLARDSGLSEAAAVVSPPREALGPVPYPAPTPLKDWVDRFGDAPRKGSDILVQALEREGVDVLFAYPGGASMEIHQALTRSDSIRNILCRHEQGEIFAAEGYAKVSGRVGVCIATSGPGATNLVTGLADALLDSVPLVAITGQVPRKLIGSDGFQETPIVEVTRQITKHNYLVMDVNDIPRVVKEAFYLARSGRPGPVLVDVPKDLQQTLALAEFVAATGIPVAQTLMGLGAFSEEDPLALHMLGMHGTVYANYAVNDADLLIALGVRFDDRVTGKLEAFAARACVVHIDIDPAEISKNKEAHIPVCADVKPALALLNRMLRAAPVDRTQFAPWVEALEAKRAEFPLRYPTDRDDLIMPQRAIEMLYEETAGDAIVTTGVGQHQMWAAQFYKFKEPRRWVTSGGLGSMGFGLPSALGAAAAFDGKDGRPKKVVVDIDGDGSFVMNCQELATAAVEGLETKCFILNNQHLGMVMQWEDRFYKANRAHTYLGRKEAEYHVTKDLGDIYPDFVTLAKAFNIPARRVIDPKELRSAIREMLDTPGPFLLDIIVPHIQHVLPMIPGGGSFKESITEGDGSIEY
ncbi:Acetolactate synthase 1, chloroplastic [Auxenochlorella protothecoides]|uniref:acetolactate synthase n=1 Tax=Auxenochlorella protothecoides TaxID=3075 RepID=A0A087SSI7_AUXPR|nr:Acetolactate synthase 1, chloroplastic [Auxenochlorella protothecoides]KFM28691.1 Acetolactate synthase 1, chloroplastic [Auxenochlorella protothecoides]